MSGPARLFFFLASLWVLGCGGNQAPGGEGGVGESGGASGTGGVGGVGGALGAGGTSGTSGGDLLATLDDDVAKAMMTAHVPGMAITIVKGDTVITSRGYGFADIAAGRKATPDTLFLLASISKSVMAVALMQAYEQGSFGLDDPIDAKLPFAVRNPSFPAVPITYRMLLTHTSSIRDSATMEATLTFGGDSPVPLAEFLEQYLTPGGAYYLQANWDKAAAPGESYDYSNVGAALAGELVEVIAGENLQVDCQKRTFGPLGMNESAWFYAGLDPMHVATPYETDDQGNFTAVQPYGFADYPDGQLRTSAGQLARFMMALIGGGELGGATILKKATVDEMLKPQVPALDPAQGLILYHVDLGDHHLVGHSGGYIGATTDMYFNPETGAGFVMVSNSDLYLLHASGPEVDAMLNLELELMNIARAWPSP